MSRALESYGTTQRHTKGTTGWTHDEWFFTRLVQNQSCSLTFSRKFEFSNTTSPSRNTSTDSTSFNLVEIDPSSISYVANESGSDQNASWTHSGYIVLMTTHDLAKKIMVSSSDGSQRQANSISIDVSEKEMTSRLVQALTHAVELCGGKKSAF